MGRLPFFFNGLGRFINSTFTEFLARPKVFQFIFINQININEQPSDAGFKLSSNIICFTFNRHNVARLKGPLI